jgi:hypothetical protein
LACTKQIRVDNSDPFLQCALCQKFLHRTCTEVTQQHYDLINRINSPVRFFCEGCDGHIDEDLRSIQDLREKYEALSQKHEALASKVEDMEKKMATPGGGTGAPPGMDAFMIEVVPELQDQDRRKTNIILAGVPESPSPDPAKRKAEDAARIKEVIAIICPGLEVEVRAAFRLGQHAPGSGKPRLLKAVLGSIEQQQQVVSSARELRKLDEDHVFFKVYLNADRTPTQRSLDKARRERVRAARGSRYNGNVPDEGDSGFRARSARPTR